MNSSPPTLVLASSSAFRRQQLERLTIPFICDSPDVDESPLRGETPRALVERLSLAKAAAVAARHRHSLVIGSDQVAVLDGAVLGKPGSHARAVEQLTRASGREVVFLTGLTLLADGGARAQLDVARTVVGFRSLTAEQIERYLRHDQPYQCAGSIRSESLGPVLFSHQSGDDPSALIGLPLIRLTRMLARFGMDVLASADPPPVQG